MRKRVPNKVEEFLYCKCERRLELFLGRHRTIAEDKKNQPTGEWKVQGLKPTVITSKRQGWAGAALTGCQQPREMMLQRTTVSHI